MDFLSEPATPRFWAGCLLAVVMAVGFVVGPRADTIGPRMFTRAQLCKAAISVVMGRSPRIMKVSGETGGEVRIFYFRPDDGKFWAQKCKTVGNRIVWGAIDGRWRDRAAWDEVITYREDAAQKALVIDQLFSDGSKTSDMFRAIDV